MMWWNGNGYDASGSKTEHNSPDTRPGQTAFIQGSTAGYFGHYYVHDIIAALDGEGDFPAELDASYFVYQGENDITGQIDLNGAGLYNIVEECPGAEDATVNCDRDFSVKSTFEDIDGLEVVAAEEGLFVVIQEDSGNDLGERMFISSVLEHEADGEELTYHYMAQSGGQYDTRMSSGVGIPATASGGGGSHEFSGVIDLSGMLAKTDGMRRRRGLRATKAAKKNPKAPKAPKSIVTDPVEPITPSTEFMIKAHDGEAKRIAEHKVPINDKLIAFGLQAHNFYSGIIDAFKADRGGQVLVYQPNI